MGREGKLPELPPAEPVEPVAPYLGGKRNLARRLIARIEKVPHRLYAEPFVGMGGVFLRRRFAAPVVVINDYSREVATFFRILQRHYVPFLEMMRFQLTTRAEFERLVATDPATLTDLERAARFLYLQRTAFGGKVSGRNFGVSPDRPARFDITQLGPMLEALHGRLAGVTIECLPFAEFTAATTASGRCSTSIRTLKGRFILSLNNVPQVREAFAGFRIERAETMYTVAAKGRARGRVGQVVVSGACRRIPR